MKTSDLLNFSFLKIFKKTIKRKTTHRKRLKRTKRTKRTKRMYKMRGG
jgi:hypothetical protein